MSDTKGEILSGEQLRILLVSFTKDPIETLYVAWQASKTDDPLMLTDEVKRRAEIWKNDITGPEGFKAINPEEMYKMFWDVVEMNIPIARFISFVFTFEGMAIALREQFVREKFGWDFWLQSGRIRDQSKFYDNGWFHVPKSILKAQQDYEAKLPQITDDSVDPIRPPQRTDGPLYVFLWNLESQQQAYKKLVRDFSIPGEDARELIGLALTHKGGASTNLSGLIHTISKRSCQILQLGLWEPMVTGILDELANKIHPEMRKVASPPCMRGDQFMRCPYNLDNERRVNGEDRLAPCSLWMTHVYMKDSLKRGLTESTTPMEEWNRINDQKPSPQYGRDTVEKYKNFWGRNPWTGKLHLKVQQEG